MQMNARDHISEDLIDPRGTIVFFDGECGLCNKFVKFVIKYNSQRDMRYCWLQSDIAVGILTKKDVVVDMSSIILIDNDRVYFESEAFLRIVSKLDYPARLLFVLRVFPRFVANYTYRLISRRRYGIFGKSEMCEIPKEEHRDLFI
jgi:predicted DCC family thiol-disulfide oxidoreductase YuxK